MFQSPQRPLFTLALLTAFSCLWDSSAAAQDLEPGNRTFAEKPIGILWHTGFSEGRALNYVSKIADDFKFGDDLDETIRREIEKRRSVELPVKGMAIYMVKGFVPAFEELEFVEVADDDAFMDMINEQRKNWGERAELTGTGNKRTLTVTNSWETTKVKQVTKTRENGEEYTVNEAVLDDEGKPVKETNSWSRTTYFRLADNVVYTGTFPEVHTMPLPATDTLGLGSRKKPDDLYFDVDLKQIPRGFKDLFWNTVSTQTGTWLQQKDAEADYRYGVRRPAGDCGLALMKAVIYDIDRVTVSIRLATDTKPVQARVNAQVRENSSLAKALKDLRKSRPLLAPDDRAIFTFNSAWNMPESFRDVVTAIGPMMREGAKLDFQDAALLAAVDQMATAFEATGERGQFETSLRLSGTADSGPVLYGGIRFEDEQRFAQGMSKIIAEQVPIPGVETFKSTSGQQYLRIPLPDISKEIGTTLAPTHLYITGGGNAVWLAVGTESAYHMLEHQLQAGAGGDRGPAPRGSSLAEITFDAKRLVTPDDEAGFDELAAGAEMDFDRLVTGSFARSRAGELPPARGFLKDALAGKDAKAHIVLDADDDGLFIRGELDESVGRWFVARYMSTVNRAMTAQRQVAMERQQEARRKAEEAQRKAAEGQR